MINILSYVGMNLQSELCLWTLLGLLRTVFDATLFKVNANLKQVWQMSMPEELSLPVQHVLRTMISGIMLVQCFTVYVYLASYVVLLYPVFLEERPTLVLPWLLLAAIRSLLCELTSLALGLGTCVLLGPARPPCIKFLILKIVAILPVFYMWMLVFSYYHALKLAATFKAFPTRSSTTNFDPDYGLELAVRRRRTKSLFGEDELRKNLVAGLYCEGTDNFNISTIKLDHEVIKPTRGKSSDSSISENQLDDFRPLSAASNKFTDVNAYEDWLLSETIMPRGSDRILEQFVVMLFKVAAYIKRDGTESIDSQIFNTDVNSSWVPRANIEAVDISETPLLVANRKGPTASYIQEYPQIFMKKLSSEVTSDKCRQMNNSANTVSSTSQSNSRQNRSESNNKPVDVHTLPTLEEFQQNTNLSVISSEAILPVRLNKIKENSKYSIEDIESLEKEDFNDISMESKHQETIKLESSSKTSANTILNEELNGEDQESKVMEVGNSDNLADNTPDALNTDVIQVKNNSSLSSDKQAV